MGTHETQLDLIVTAQSWKLPELTTLNTGLATLEQLMKKLAAVTSDPAGPWQGAAALAVSQTFTDLAANFSAARDVVVDTAGALSQANIARNQAVDAEANLPSASAPMWVHIAAAGTIAVPSPFWPGLPVAANVLLGVYESFLRQEREKKALEILTTLEHNLSGPTLTLGAVEPVPNKPEFPTAPYSGGDINDIPSRPFIATGGGGSGGGGSDLHDPPERWHENPWNPEWEPPVEPGPYPPGPPYYGGPPPVRHDGPPHVSVDGSTHGSSGGSGFGSGSGGAGIGGGLHGSSTGVGLAAASKVAGTGGLGMLGGAGATSAVGVAGGAAAAKGGSPMMGGGQGGGGGGGEKDKRTSLGLVAPTIEDDDEPGGRSASAGAGGRE